MDNSNVVEFKQPDMFDVTAALKNIVAQLESGELEACQMGALILWTKTGVLIPFGFGHRVDEMKTQSLFRLGEQLLIDQMLAST